jgi:hypothetical protein
VLLILLIAFCPIAKCCGQESDSFNGKPEATASEQVQKIELAEGLGDRLISRLSARVANNERLMQGFLSTNEEHWAIFERRADSRFNDRFAEFGTIKTQIKEQRRLFDRMRSNNEANAKEIREFRRDRQGILERFQEGRAEVLDAKADVTKAKAELAKYRMFMIFTVCGTAIALLLSFKAVFF